MKNKEFWGKVIFCILMSVVMLGVCVTDALIEKGMAWVLIVMIIGPFYVGYLLEERGWFEWMDDKYTY